MGVSLIKGNQFEMTVFRGHVHFDFPVNQGSLFDPVFDQVFN
jgi:hypothetical protein